MKATQAFGIRVTQAVRHCYHSLEKTTMECRTEVMYVEKHELSSSYPSIEDSFKNCYDETEDGGCTLILPQNETQRRGNLFPIGSICNLRVNCVLDNKIVATCITGIKIFKRK